MVVDVLPTDVDPAHEPLERRQCPDPLVDAGIDAVNRAGGTRRELAPHLGDELRVVLAPVPRRRSSTQTRESRRPRRASGTGSSVKFGVSSPSIGMTVPIRRATDGGRTASPAMVRVADGEDPALF